MTTTRVKRRREGGERDLVEKSKAFKSRLVDQEGCQLNKTTYSKNKPQEFSTSLYQNAKAVFRRTAIPSRLVGRSLERETMVQFYQNSVLSNQSGSFYISGMPGTGKTAMLTEVIQTMESEIEQLKHKVNTTVINCMTIKEPKQIYLRLVEAWKPKIATVQSNLVQQAHSLMNAKKNILNVVILDEIDSLITKEQDVLYKLFEWASSPDSRLVLIGIANALDLTDRILPRLRAKNCEPELLNFNPYSVSEVSTIIKDRLYSLVDISAQDAPLPLFQPAAVELCSRKIAASMGDLRTALDVCRQAIEVAEMEQKKLEKAGEKEKMEPKVSIKHVMLVLNTVFGSPMVQKLKQLNLQQKIVLGVLYIMKKTSKDITTGKFRKEYSILCGDTVTTVSAVTKSELNDLVSMLETSSLLSLSKSKEETARKIQLNIQENEILQMIEDVPLLSSWLNEALTKQGLK